MSEEKETYHAGMMHRQVWVLRVSIDAPLLLVDRDFYPTIEDVAEAVEAEVRQRLDGCRVQVWIERID